MNHVITKLSQSFFLVWRQKKIAFYSLNGPLTSLYVKTKGITLDLFVHCYFPLCVSHLKFLKFLILVSKHMYSLQKPQRLWLVVWVGKKRGFHHMLMCSFVHFYFVCEHLFTFQISALMPKISKENCAQFYCDKIWFLTCWGKEGWPVNNIVPLLIIELIFQLTLKRCFCFYL